MASEKYIWQPRFQLKIDNQLTKKKIEKSIDVWLNY